MSFVHLHTWSWYSFLRGGSSPAALASQAKALGQPALALTDYMTVAGAVQFQLAARAAGIRAVIGAEICLEGEPVVLLAPDDRGYTTLNMLLTQAYEREKPLVRLQDLADCNQGVFLLTGSDQGRLYRLVHEQRFTEARAWVEQLRKLVPGRVFVELSSHRTKDSGRTLRWLSQLAHQAGLHTVAANAVRFATPGDFLTHDLLNRIRLKIRYNEPHPELSTNSEGYLKGLAEMREVIEDPTALSNTLRLAEECSLNLLPGEITPPGAILPLGFDHYNDYLIYLCRESLPNKYPDPRRRAEAEARLAHELEIIFKVDVGEFFLVVREVMDFARRRGIRCAGRGSAGNSIVAYLLDITTVCPLQHGLLFERFLHEGRKGTPDIDVDFDTARRDEVIEWMIQRFSTEHTAMAANVNTYGLRSAVQDVAKVLGWSNDIAIHQMTKGLSGWSSPADVTSPGVREALASVPGVGESPMLDVLIDCVARLEGCPRHLSLHSGGMVLARKPLSGFSPVQTSANGVKQLTFNKEDVEYLGLVKLDVLGLRAMSALSYAVELVEQFEGYRPDIDNLSLDDPRVYDLICSGKTIGLFQVESPGQRNLIAKAQPRNFKELTIQITILRPGPIEGGAIPPYVRRLRGLEPATPPHPSLAKVLQDTQGLILFQEQVMEVSYVFAGLSVQEADDFRRLMSKARDPRKMEAMRQKFVESAQNTHPDVTPEVANRVFDMVAKFVGYGFPKSHAAAFARTVYQSAWLKTYHPAAFLAATMRHWPGMYPMQSFIEEARHFGIPVLPPQVLRSQLYHTLERFEGKLAIRQPLTDVKGVGEEDARAILLEREARPFENLEDFYRRVRVGWDAVDALAKAGALDSLSTGQELLLRLDSSSRTVRRDVLWQVGILHNRLGPPGCDALPLMEPEAIAPSELARLAQLTPTERMIWDFRFIGSTTDKHPIALKRFELAQLGVIPINQVAGDYASAKEKEGRNTREGRKVVSVAGLVVTRQRPISAHGVVFLTLQDETGDIQCIIVPEVWERLETVLRAGTMVVTGTVTMVGANWKGIQVFGAHPLVFEEVEMGLPGGPYQVLPHKPPAS